MAKRDDGLNGIKTRMSGVLHPTQWGGRYFVPFPFLSIPLPPVNNSFLSNNIKNS